MANFAGGGGGGGAQGVTSADIAAQRYAYIRLNQAVQAGLLPASTLNNLHPEQYPALWRMVSQNVGAPAAAAGYADPGMWLRNGGQGVGGMAPQGVPAGGGYDQPAPMTAPHALGPPIVRNPNVAPNQVIQQGIGGMPPQPAAPDRFHQLIAAGMDLRGNTGTPGGPGRFVNAGYR